MELEAKILAFINQNTDGVKISEMEKPLCEKRMKLGFIVKNLLDEGKILKISDKYYPKNGTRYLINSYFLTDDNI
jgi:hypothetical protein